MKLRTIRIRNFKAVEDTTIKPNDFTVVVGANGSGKSSILQALHWMFQSAIHRQVRPRKDGGETLSERDALYMPTPEYRNAGFGTEYGNKVGSPQLDLSIQADCKGEIFSADMWIKSGRNEGIKVRIPAENELVRRIRDEKREISAYIPGLAGISLQEQKLAKLLVHRLAAAGDANTVLRNILFLLKDKGDDGDIGVVQNFVSRIMDDVTLRVDFDENQHTQIAAEFQTADMRNSEPKRFKPVELAGIGFLQVIQIFAYLVYFRPVFLLVDEPDAHLHPATQERLIQVLAEAAKKFDTQVLLTTHSPSVIRGLPEASRVIWMREGKVQPDGDTTGRQMMGWGLLDKKVLLLTEDSKTEMLRSILAQWPDLERLVALWPLHGSGKLLDAAGCASLQALLGTSMKIILHRDRDFLMPAETEAFVEPYRDKGISVWLTRNSDVEAYFAETNIIASHYGVDKGTANSWLKEAVAALQHEDADQACSRSKRNAIQNQPPLKKLSEKGQLAHFSDADVVAEYSKDGTHHVVLGKNLLGAVRKAAQDNGGSSKSVLGKSIPEAERGKIASDLRHLLNEVLE